MANVIRLPGCPAEKVQQKRPHDLPKGVTNLTPHRLAQEWGKRERREDIAYLRGQVDSITRMVMRLGAELAMMQDE